MKLCFLNLPDQGAAIGDACFGYSQKFDGDPGAVSASIPGHGYGRGKRQEMEDNEIMTKRRRLLETLNVFLLGRISGRILCLQASSTCPLKLIFAIRFYISVRQFFI